MDDIDLELPMVIQKTKERGERIGWKYREMENEAGRTGRFLTNCKAFMW